MKTILHAAWATTSRLTCCVLVVGVASLSAHAQAQAQAQGQTQTQIQGQGQPPRQEAAAARALPAAAIVSSRPGNFETSSGGTATPQRAVVLAPHITELMYAAGAGQYIVATIDRSDFPSHALDIPRVGDGISVSAEAVFASRPDIILDWRPSGASSTLKALADRQGIPVIYIEPRSLDDIPSQVKRLGRLFGTGHHAIAAALTLQQHIDSLRHQYGQRRPLSVFIQIGDPPLFTIGSDPVLNDALKACGGNNIFAGLATEAAQVSRESVLLKQPDVVITPQTDTQHLQALRSRWAGLGLEAAHNGNVYAINADQLFRPGPRLIDATQRLCKLLDATR